MGLTEIEDDLVESMFRYFDNKNEGRISRHLAMKLLTQIGLGRTAKLPSDLSLEELKSTIEVLSSSNATNSIRRELNLLHLIMDPEYMAESSLVDEPALRAVDLLKILQTAGATKEDVNKLLCTMADWDDCSVEPMIKCSTFDKEILKVVEGNRQLAAKALRRKSMAAHKAAGL